MTRTPASRWIIPWSLALILVACGGGGSGPKIAADFNPQAAYTKLIKTGFTAAVILSGSVTVNGVATPFSGSGTLTYAPAVTGTFNNLAAVAQDQNIAGTVVAGGQQAQYSSSVTDYFDATSYAALGESYTGEYDVVQNPFTLPTTLTGGSSGTLYAVNRYTDSTQSVPLGTAQISYSFLTPIDPGSNAGVVFTTKIYDTQNALLETDVTQYALTTGNVLLFSTATVQRGADSLIVALPAP